MKKKKYDIASNAYETYALRYFQRKKAKAPIDLLTHVYIFFCYCNCLQCICTDDMQCLYADKDI